MVKQTARCKNYEDLPLILDIEHIQNIMGISRAKAYALVHEAGFPLIRNGRLLKVSKRMFFKWLEGSERHV